MRAFEIVVLSRTLIYLLFSFIHFTLCANTSLLCCVPLWTGTVKTFSVCQRSMQFGMHPGFLPTVTVLWLLPMLMISTVQHAALQTQVKFHNGTRSRQAYSSTLAGAPRTPALCINISFSFLASCTTHSNTSDCKTQWVTETLAPEPLRHWLLRHFSCMLWEDMVIYVPCHCHAVTCWVSGRE